MSKGEPHRPPVRTPALHGVRRALALLLATALALAACRAPGPPPPGASGPEIYRQQLCANCHGDAGRGTSRGPALRRLDRFWKQDELARFLADPLAFRGEPRIRRYRRRFPSRMQPYDVLSEEDRQRLAAALLDGMDSWPEP